MSGKIAVFLAEGFEEIEAVTPIDVLRRAGFDVVSVAIGDMQDVQGAHGVRYVADAFVDEINASDFFMSVFPGGLPGATNLAADERVLAFARDVYANGGIVSAICAAPIALAAAGLLNGAEYTCYPGFEKQIGGAYTGNRVCVSGRIITGCGPGASLEFAMALVQALGKDPSQLKQGMLAAN